MPRRRRKNALAELGDQWIAYLPHSANLYRFWTDARIGRTRWATLGTSDIEEAKLRLAEIVIKAAPVNFDAPLAIVLERYFEEHTDERASKGVARSAGGVLLGRLGGSIRISELTEARQREFVKALLADGYKLSYAARIMTVLAAALRHVGNLQPGIIYTESKMKTRWHLSSTEPKKAYIPSDEECARLFNTSMPASLRRFMVLSILTAGRPGAVVDLSPTQRNRSAGTLNLNPPDHAQNKKFRPLVRQTRLLSRFLTAWEKAGLGPHGNRYCG